MQKVVQDLLTCWTSVCKLLERKYMQTFEGKEDSLIELKS